MPSLIILRGLPGAGKTSLARLIGGDQCPVFSVDDYFTDKATGAYHFRFAENHLAYKKCQQDTKTAMIAGTEKIIVDNTFTLDWEIAPYFEMAALHNYRVHVATVENYHQGSNKHGISDEQVKKMAEKYRVKLF